MFSPAAFLPVIAFGCVFATGYAVWLLRRWRPALLHRVVRRHPMHLALFVGTAVACALQVPLGIFGPQAPMDNPAHLAFPATAGVLAYSVLMHGARLSRRHYFVVLVVFGMSTEFLWEIAEWQLDATVGTRWQVDNADTMHDLSLGALGAVAGAAAEIGLNRWVEARTPVPAEQSHQVEVPRARQQGLEHARGSDRGPRAGRVAAPSRQP